MRCKCSLLIIHFNHPQFIHRLTHCSFRPVWLCSQCYVYYENEEIEIRLLDVIHRKIMSYTLQDLRCTRCKEIKRDNMAELCSCAGTFDTLIDAQKLRQLLRTFLDVAETHQMHLLKDEVQIFLTNSY